MLHLPNGYRRQIVFAAISELLIQKPTYLLMQQTECAAVATSVLPAFTEIFNRVEGAPEAMAHHLAFKCGKTKTQKSLIRSSNRLPPLMLVHEPVQMHTNQTFDLVLSQFDELIKRSIIDAQA